ncbi:hypothetical protein HO173_008205 [Letharia columbiana]|uniref:Uncharacterized protein n=1 Tax=Letharia columbiana TaxID=112416 RepID=A0A8H6FS39_9LECA|nr:uncharacterized protein HO173_008205 [Letharia columbiana]KAF6233648.1 hypothetical protein HO173_008205 [Letharia columbiana]
MSLLGKKFNGLFARPMAPFFIAGLIMMYGINSAANALAQSEQFKNDPRNPNSKTQKPADKR